MKKPAAVRAALARLLPLFADERFLTDVKYAGSIKAVSAGQEIETRNARETVLFRLGTLSRVVAPDLYTRYETLFDARTAKVRDLADAGAVAAARTQWNVASTAPAFDFATAPIDQALAEWRKRTELNSRLEAAGTLIGRADLSPAQKQAVIAEMLGAIRVADQEVRGTQAGHGSTTR